MIGTRHEHPLKHLPGGPAVGRFAAWRYALALVGGMLILAVIVWASWLSGGVGYRMRPIVYLSASAACGLIFLGALVMPRNSQTTRLYWPLALVPLLCGIAWGAFQLVPWRNVSPTVHGTAMSPPADETSSAEAQSSTSQRWPLSFYPAATRASLAWLTLAMATFLAGAVLARNQAWTPWLLGILAVNGAALAFMGIAEILSVSSGAASAGGPSWGKNFATYVNRNNAAGFLNLSLAAAVGMFLWGLPDRLGNLGNSHNRRQSLGSRLGKSYRNATLRVSRLNAAHLATLVIAVLTLAGVIASTSRGGVVAAGAGGLALLIVLTLRGNVVRLLAGAALVVALAVSLIVWTGLDDSVMVRLSTLYGGNLEQNGRIPHWQDALDASREHWVFGTGLGTYRYAYLPYESQPNWGWFIHAENQYVESLLELGVPGLLLLLTAIGLVGWAALDLVRSGDKHDFALGVAGVLALATQGAASFFDFGLYLPANMLGLALLAGAVCGRAALREGAARWTRLPLSGFLPVRFGILASVILFIAAVGYTEVRAAAASAGLDRETPVLNSPDALSPPLLEQRIAAATSVLNRRPDDALAHRLLANLKIYQFRRAAYEGQIASRPGLTAEQKDAVWEQTRLETLYAAANQWHQRHRTDLVKRLASEPLVASHLRLALDHLLRAKEACPLLPRIELPLALLSFIDDPAEPAGLAHVRRAVLLAPVNAELLYRAGVMAEIAGDKALAENSWRRALQVDPSQLFPVFDFARKRRSLAEILEQVLPDSPQLAMNVFTDPRFSWTAGERKLLLEHCQKLQQAAGPPASPADYYRQGRICQLSGKPRQAIGAYQQALVLAPNQIDWRLELAKLLRDTNQLSAAQDALRKAARQAPDRTDIAKLLEQTTRELILQPTFTLSEES